MGKEFELKFRADSGTLARIENAMGGGFTPMEMRTTYYDTPQGALSARKWTLRCRMENGRSVCTLKTPGNGLSRGEWDCECTDILAAVPLLAQQAELPELTELAGAGLIRVCGAAFVRRCKLLTLGRTMVELALDEGVLENRGVTMPFAEAELELKSGSEETMLLFARKFQGDFGLVAEEKSKFARARALGQEE